MAVSCGMGGKLDFYYTRTYIPAHIQTHSNSKYYPNDDCAFCLDFQRMTYEIHCSLVYKRVEIAMHRQTYTRTTRHTHAHIAFYKRVVSVCLSIANMTDNGQTYRHTPTTHSPTFPSVPPPPYTHKHMLYLDIEADVSVSNTRIATEPILDLG